MVNAASSITQSLVSLIGTPSRGAASFGSGSVFGPDFLLSVLGANSAAFGSAYNAQGRSYSPPAGSPAAKARDDALSQAQAAISSGDFAAGIDLAQGVLKKDPQNVIALYVVGHSYLQEGDYANATKYLQQATYLTGNSQIQNELTAAQLLPQGADAVLARVHQLLQSRSTVTQGLSLTTLLLNKDPKNVAARVVLVDYYDANGYANLASAELAGALSGATAEELGALVQRTERFAAAHSGDAAIQGLLGQAYARVGRFDDAATVFADALNLASQDTELQNAIKKGYADALTASGQAALQRNDSTAASAAFQQALSLDRTDARRSDLANLQYDQANEQLRAGNLRGGLSLLDKARINLPISGGDDLKKKLIASYEGLAGKFNDVGDLQHVVAARNGAYQLDPKNDTRKRTLADANDTYGQSLAGNGDYFGAIKSFNAALKLYTGDTNYAAHLADAQGHV